MVQLQVKGLNSEQIPTLLCICWMNQCLPADFTSLNTEKVKFMFSVLPPCGSRKNYSAAKKINKNNLTISFACLNNNLGCQ